MKILIIDDEQIDLFITKKLLGTDYDVVGFTNLPDTLGWAQNNSFDLVLIDYYLAPGVYAHDALKELIAIKVSKFKAYVLSNYVDEKQAQDLKDAGFTDIMYKPLTVEKFKEYLKVSVV